MRRAVLLPLDGTRPFGDVRRKKLLPSSRRVGER